MATQAPKGFLLVLTNCTDPAREQEFNDWYTNVHIPDVMGTPGIVRGLRFGLTGEPREGQAKFLALYELDTDDVASVQKALGEAMAGKREEGRMIDCIQGVANGYYSLISDRQKQATPR